MVFFFHNNRFSRKIFSIQLVIGGDMISNGPTKDIKLLYFMCPSWTDDMKRIEGLALRCKPPHTPSPAAGSQHFSLYLVSEVHSARVRSNAFEFAFLPDNARRISTPIGPPQRN